MICAIEMKQSFCTLKSFKIGYMGVAYVYPQIFHFSEKSMLSTYLDIFQQVRPKSGVWKIAYFISSCIPGIFYNPRS